MNKCCQFWENRPNDLYVFFIFSTKGKLILKLLAELHWQCVFNQWRSQGWWPPFPNHHKNHFSKGLNLLKYYGGGGGGIVPPVFQDDVLYILRNSAKYHSDLVSCPPTTWFLAFCVRFAPQKQDPGYAVVFNPVHVTINQVNCFAEFLSRASYPIVPCKHWACKIIQYSEYTVYFFHIYNFGKPSHHNQHSMHMLCF